MILPAELQQKYEYLHPYIQQVAKTVTETVVAFADREGFAYASRIKSIESAAEKVESGRYSGWRDLDDLFGCVIIVPTLREEERALRFLRATFDEVETRLRASTQKQPENFRFDTTRFIGQIRAPAGSDPPDWRYRIKFEIQIRTAFEHAWSVTTHALAYKTHAVDWNTARLAAQLRASIEQLDMLVLGFDEAAKQITPSYWPEVAAKRAVIDFFVARIEDGTIPTEHEPKDWSRFGDNFYSLLRANAGRNVRPVDMCDSALAIIERELKQDASRAPPRSLSLLQWCIGILATARFLSAPLYRYTPPITRDLILLYPAVAAFGPGFHYETEPGE